MSRRPSLTLGAIAIALTVFFFFVFSPTVRETAAPAVRMTKESFRKYDNAGSSDKNDVTVDDIKTKPDVVPNQKIIQGTPIMAKMKNQTVRAELGRAAWKVFHTILAQYPEHPEEEDRQTLTSYIHLFSRVYPCRECAEDFQKLLKKYPPQVSSREHASQWGCHIHNQVNQKLHKEWFDCNEISDKYNCGCGDEDEEEASSGGQKAKASTNSEKLEIDQKDELTKGG